MANERVIERELPIYSALEQLRSALTSRNTVILQAPPGAGKSTVVPIELRNESWLNGGKIIMLEPRRLAARAVAERMAALLGEQVGGSVGYRMRFESRVSDRTQIEVVTEGILTRMLQSDTALAGVGLVIFDEFHERSLAADLALALAQQSQQILRDDLRILIMSATINANELSRLLSNAPIVTAEGRQYPIALRYVAVDSAQPIAANVAAIIRQALRDEEGDILAFLPGTAEIAKTAHLLHDIDSSRATVLPLYGDLSSADQRRALTPDAEGRRKIVLATSIAETSLTIAGIRTAVDSGYSRVSRFDPGSGLTRLVTVRVTRDAADQRAGRAGRLGPGTAYRLWSEASHHALLAERVPEILEADLAPLALELANWGVKDPAELDWLTPPPTGALLKARELLEGLEALHDGAITAKGKAMLRLPTHPRLAHMLLEGEADGNIQLAIDLASILEERDPLPRDSGADLALRLEALRRSRGNRRGGGSFARIELLAERWRRLFRVGQSDRPIHEHELGKLVAAAYPERIARATGVRGQYRLANGRIAKLPEHDPLSGEEWLAVAHLDAGQREGRIYLAAALDVKDVEHRSSRREVVEWDSRLGVLVARSEERIGDIVLSTKPLTQLPEELRVSVLCKAIRDEGLRTLRWDDRSESLRTRIGSLHAWHPEEEWPDVSDEALLATLGSWLAPHLLEVRKRDDFRKLDLAAILLGMLGWQRSRRLDELAPKTIAVPSGSEIKLEYFLDGRAPVLAVRLQEVFGLTDTPRVNDGRTPVLLHLLSPGYKPVQVTQDLRSFWQNAYQEVRKELRIRYPKHSWPEDPWTATAIRGAVRRVKN